VTAWMKQRATGLMALGLFLGSFLLIFTWAPETGYTRDEGFYFDAAKHYAGWFSTLVRDPDKALTEAGIRRHFEINREHPVLIKNLMAISYLALAKNTPAKPASFPPDSIGTYARAMRLPSQLFSALAVCLTFLLGTSLASRRVGLLAALAFLLAPRHFYHAQLACFDMPAVAMWLATVWAFRKARVSVKWSLLTGIIWGLALATKHNSFFLPVVLVIHWLIVQGKEFSLGRRGLSFPRIPLAFFAMLILGPLVFLAHWPFLWHQTIERIGWYFGFHLHHVHYPWEYFGTLLTEPPFPFTLPLPTLFLGVWGFGSELGRRLGHPLRSLLRALGRFAGLEQKTPEDQGALDTWDSWLLLLNIFIPFAVIALPKVPIFGGVKHWMHAMPFFCILGAITLERMLRALPPPAIFRKWKMKLDTALFAMLALLLLTPSVQGIVRHKASPSSSYNALIGGLQGAADAGMQRQYWSDSIKALLPVINEKLPPRARLYLHEVTSECFRAYKRDGWLRPDIRPSYSPEGADFTAFQVHREFADIEYRIWNKTGHASVAAGLYIDDVPIVLLYDTRGKRAKTD